MTIKIKKGNDYRIIVTPQALTKAQREEIKADNKGLFVFFRVKREEA